MTSPQGRFEAGAALLDGRVLEEVFSYGKHLFARFGGDTLHVHLGLYGTFTSGTGHAARRRAARCGCAGRATVRTAPACGPTCAARPPARCWPRPRSTAILARLGPDPLRPRADGALAHRRIARSRTAIGALLMDQSVLAGVGNVYRAELLFRHGVSPFRPGRGVDGDAVGADVGRPGRAHAGRASGWAGSSPPGPRTARAAAGRSQREDAHYVYRRTGLPCRVCGTEVRTEVMVGPQPLLVPGLPGRLTARPSQPFASTQRPATERRRVYLRRR